MHVAILVGSDMMICVCAVRVPCVTVMLVRPGGDGGVVKVKPISEEVENDILGLITVFGPSLICVMCVCMCMCTYICI